ncbi:hypothetical protein [Blattabacterium punctulatus]|nr:hypothetical protein [Blattabacterium punctulatus]
MNLILEIMEKVFKKKDYDLISKDILEYIRHYNLFQKIFIGHSIVGWR